MDYIPSLVFPFDRTDPHDDQLPCQQYHTAGQQNNNQLIFNPLEYGSDLKRPETTNIFAVNDDNSKKMKIMRRDIERHRRQEMSTLYRSLRSLLPLEYLKGKRSMSDHMNEAVNYIKNLQNRIQKLSEKRDELRRLSNSSSSPYYSTTSESECSQTHINLEDSVTVRPCLAGVEVAINTSFRKGIPLSQVVALLAEEGLTVVNCISTKINERLLHNIESEVNDGGRNIDPFELQQKIMKLTSPSSN